MRDLNIIIGLGKTGLSSLRYLISKGYNVAVTDTREKPPGLAELQQHFPHVPAYLGQLDNQLLKQASRLIVSPGLSIRQPAIAYAQSNGVPVVGDIELFAQAARAPIVAITGSNAKGTVTTMLGDMARCAGLEVRVGGNIGIPALDLLSDKEPQLYVLELSSFQLETTHSLHAQAATILNVTPDHMDRYETFSEYVMAKQRIYQRCKVAVYNREDPHTPPRDFVGSQVTFGLSEPAEGQWGLCMQEGRYNLSRGKESLLPVSELKVKGQHNWINALAALALGSAAHIPLPAMLQALREFSGLPHRCQWIRELKGVHYYDDSKGTNVGATVAAIEGLSADIEGKLILIAGGLGKEADFMPLRQPISKHVKSIILIGKDAPLLEKVLPEGVNVFYADTMVKAVELSTEQAKPGDCVLLSPACASFDMFRDYEHRGEEFVKAVRDLT